MVTATPAVQIDHEQLAADAQRLAALYDGAIALLTGECKPTAVTTARGVLLEARAIVSTIASTIEGLAARQAEADRARRAHELAQAQITRGTVVGGGR